MTVVQTDHEYASELELEAAEYPEERGEILIEAAYQWQRAGDLARAARLLEEAHALGGLDAAYASAALAELCFDGGNEQEGWAHIAALEVSGPIEVGPAELVAELLEERGEYSAAQHWFELAISRLGDDELAAMGHGDRPSPHAGLLFGRHRCRQAQGLPADELDLAAGAEQRHRVVARTMGRYAARGPALVRILVWQREQQGIAACRWPELFTDDVLDHYAEVERRVRDLSRVDPAVRYTMVTGDVDGFAAYLERTGEDPMEEQTRLSYCHEAYDCGQFVPWPPERNKPCWCGSSRKYKKCCGAPQPGPAGG